MKLIWPLLVAVSLASCASPAAPSAAQKGMKMAADQYDPNGGNNAGIAGDWWTQNQPQPQQGSAGTPPPQFIPDPGSLGWAGSTPPPTGNEPGWVKDPTGTGGVWGGQGPDPWFPQPQTTNFGQTSSPSVDPTWGGPVAPFQYQPQGSGYPTFTPPPLPDSLKNPWTLPTAQDLLSTPGYLSRYQQGLDSRQKSAAARGTILNGGTQKALDRYGTDYAQQGYQQDVDNSLQQRQQASNDYLNLAYGPAWQQNNAAVNQYGALYGQYKDSVANNRTSQNDYWQQQMDLLNAGLRAAGAGSPGSTGGQG